MKTTYVLILLLLTGCASPKQPTAGLRILLDDYRMVWLGQNLSDEEWGYLSGWTKERLIPYVAELENK